MWQRGSLHPRILLKHNALSKRNISPIILKSPGFSTHSSTLITTKFIPHFRMSTLREKSRRINIKPSSSSVSDHSVFDNKQEASINSFVKIEDNYSVDAKDSAVHNKKCDKVDSVKSESSIADIEENTPKYSVDSKINEPTPQEDQLLLASIKVVSEEHYLLKEKERSHTKIRHKALFCKFLKHLNTPCDICDDVTAQRVIKLNRQERVTAAIVLRKSLILGLKPKRILYRNFPEQSCGNCFTRIVLFRNYLKKIFLERVVKKDTQMESSNWYECSCASCINRHGQLGLFAQVLGSLPPDATNQQRSEIHQSAFQDQNVMNLDRASALEHTEGERDFHNMQDLQSIGQQMFGQPSEVMSSGSVLFPRQHDVEQSVHATANQIIPHFHNMPDTSGVDSSCLEASPVTVPFSQAAHRQHSFQNYSHFSTTASQSLVDSHEGKCRADPNFQPSTSIGYQGQQEGENIYSEFSEPLSSLSERCRLGPGEQSFTTSCYQTKEEEQKQQKAYSYSICQSVSTHTSRADCSSRENNLPVMLQDFEEKAEINLNQPSTSRGFRNQSHSEEEQNIRRTKKICTHCQKQFTHTGDFRKHLRKHTKEKPYACRQCDKKFSHTSNLHRHERSHTGDRPYTCEFCNKQFNRKDKLDSHKNSKSCKNKRTREWK